MDIVSGASASSVSGAIKVHTEDSTTSDTIEIFNGDAAGGGSDSLVLSTGDNVLPSLKELAMRRRV